MRRSRRSSPRGSDPPRHRRVSTLRYHTAFSAMARTIASPVVAGCQLLARQLSSKVWVNGGSVTFDGIRLEFPPNVGVAFASKIYWDGTVAHAGYWTTLRPLIQRSQRFVDVGSNIGLFAVLAKLINPSCEVWAFEPVPSIQTKNRQFQAANGVTGGVRLFSMALSDDEGDATLFLPRLSPDSVLSIFEQTTGTLRPDSWQATKGDPQAIVVPVCRLDSVCRRESWWPDLVKIDVEDHEASVLRGMKYLMRQFKPTIICEVLPRSHGNRETLSALRESGYRLYAITGAGLFSQEQFHSGRTFYDFLFTPRDDLPEYIPLSQVATVLNASN